MTGKQHFALHSQPDAPRPLSRFATFIIKQINPSTIVIEEAPEKEKVRKLSNIMKALHNKHATHPWTDETRYHGLHLEVDDSKVLDALVRHLEARGWSAWIVGFLETPQRRPAAYLFRKE